MNTKSRMWVMFFLLKPEWVLGKIKVTVKLYRKVQRYKTYYAETAFE